MPALKKAKTLKEIQEMIKKGGSAKNNSKYLKMTPVKKKK